MNLSIAFVTSRKEPKLNWFLDSLMPQVRLDDKIEVIVCDLHCGEPRFFNHGPLLVSVYEPKPCVWSGPHRLTKDNWWSKSNSLNTAICLAKHEWFAAVDDRCVLADTWLQSVREAQSKNRVVVGSYVKYHGMKVENGKILDYGKLDGVDGRSYPKGHQVKCGADGFFGCTWVSRLELLLEMNGIEERCHALGFEDVITGMRFINNGHSIYYDSRMFCFQDRTPSECEPIMRRTSKEKHPMDKTDKTWTALATWANEKRSNPDFDLRELREKIQRGEPFPHHDGKPSHDWFDNMPVKDFDNL